MLKGSRSLVGVLCLVMAVTIADARPANGPINPAVAVARSWLDAILKKNATTLASLSALPFDNQAFEQGSKPCPRYAKDGTAFTSLAKCMFSDEKYNDDLLSKRSSWRIVSFKVIQARYSGLPASARRPDLRSLSNAKDLIFIEGRAEPYKGVVGIFLAIKNEGIRHVVVAAIDFGDIQVDSGE